MQSKIISLLDAHRQALSCILDPINAKYNGSQIQEQSISPWKILIFDTICSNILSTLYKVGDLRELCITLHLNINQKREKLSSVTVIYFVQPNSENIQRIIEDFKQDLYSQVIINFCSIIEDSLLDQFSKGVGKIPGAASKVLKVFEHNLNFSSLNHDLYSFNLQDVYSNLYGINQLQQGKSNVIHQKLADHLYSLIQTLKVQPLIISQCKGKNSKVNMTSSQVVGGLLIENLQTRKLDDYNYSDDIQQVVLLIVERDDDLNQVLMHSNTYAALMHDIFQIKNNKVSFQSDNTHLEYDLSPLNDQLWSKSLNLSYPEVTELIDRDLAQWKLEYDKVKQQDGQVNDQIVNILSSAIDIVPQLQSQKRTLDQHVNIASSILQHVKQRQLDKFYQCGVAISQQSQGYLQQCKELFAMDFSIQKDQIKSIEYLQESDRVRILSLLLLNCNSNQQFYDEYIKLEQISNIKDNNLKKFIAYIKNKVKFGSQTPGKQQKQSNEGESFMMSSFKGLANRVKTHSKGLMLNVSNLLQREKKCALVQIIEDLFDQIKQQEILEYFKIYDNNKQQYLNQEHIDLSQYNDIIICVLEGASYNEYAELSEYAKQSNKNIIYGGSDMLSGNDIIKQIYMCSE